MEPIILASGSPRRREYFELLGLPFNIMPSRLDEGPEKDQHPRDYTQKMAVGKIKKILEQLRGRIPGWICGADTVIAVDGEIFGKAADRETAQAMLEKLRGRAHDVVTSVALFNGSSQTTDCRTVVSTVVFAPLSDRELEWYLNTGEWQGVAGAYRIQGLGACFVTSIQGSFSAISGLPLREFYDMLLKSGYQYGP
ncbi:MAG: Maf family protein [Treponema sp.]|nr:Maf family protein [Treponema sp.]